MGKLTENNKKQAVKTLKDLFESKNAYSVDIKLNEEYTMTVYAKSLTDRDLTESVKTFNKELLEDNVNVDVFDSLDLVYHSDYLPLNTLTEKLLSKVCYDLGIKHNEEKLTESVKKPAKKKAVKKDKVRFVGNPEKEISMFNSFMGESYDADAPELQKLFELLPQLKGLTPDQLNNVAEVILTDAEEEGFDCDGDIISCLADYVIDYLPGQKGSLEDLSAWVDEILDNMDIVLTTDEDEGINSIPELKDLSREKLVELGFELFGSAVAVDDDDVIDALNELIKNHYDDPETINQVIYLAQELKDQEIASRTEGESEEELEEGRKRKYIEVRVLQGNYGSGWDDLCEYEIPEDWDEAKKVYKEIRDDYNAYRENEPQYPHRVISRKKPIQNTNEPIKESLQDDIRLDYSEIKLEKEDSSEDGKEFDGKTLADFIKKSNKKYSNVDELNRDLYKKGIKPIYPKRLLNTIKYRIISELERDKMFEGLSHKFVERVFNLFVEDSFEPISAKNIKDYVNETGLSILVLDNIAGFKRADVIHVVETDPKLAKALINTYSDDEKERESIKDDSAEDLVEYTLWNGPKGDNATKEKIAQEAIKQYYKLNESIEETTLKIDPNKPKKEIEFGWELVKVDANGKETVVNKGSEEEINNLKSTTKDTPNEKFIVRKSEKVVEDYLDDRNKLAEINLKDWYKSEYPTDELGDELNDKLSLKDVYVFLKTYGAEGNDEHGDFYNYTGVADSLVRERIFEKLAKELNCKYNDIYNLWLKIEESCKGKKLKEGKYLDSFAVEGKWSCVYTDGNQRELPFKKEKYQVKTFDREEDAHKFAKETINKTADIYGHNFVTVFDPERVEVKTYEKEVEESLKEDTVKQGNAWVNKGKEGTHGKFKTKKEADAQRKAMFANGFKGESLKESRLPKTVKIEASEIELDDENDGEELGERLGNFLSDKYGFCHFGFDYDVKKDKKTGEPIAYICKNIEWDTSESLKEDLKVEDVLDWLKDHEQDYKDFKLWYKKDKMPSLEDVKDWLADHKELSKDFENYFKVKLEESFKDLSKEKIEDILEKGNYFDCTYNDYGNGKRQIDCADKGRWEKLCKELGVDKKHCGGNEVDGYVIWLSEGIEEVEKPKKEGMKDRLDAYVKSLDKKEESLEESDELKTFEVNFEVKNKIPPFEEMNNSQLVKANSEEEAIEKIIKKFGIAREKVNSAREVEIEENLTEAKDEKSTTFYSLEVGVLLPEDDDQYKYYNDVFDKKHAFFDESHLESLDEQELVNKATEYINAGVPGTYGIITEIEVENFKGIEDVIAEMNENGFIEESADFFNGEQYDIENVVWCAYKNEDEELVNDFLELEEKPAEEVEVEETEVEEESLKESAGSMKEKVERSTQNYTKPKGAIQCNKGAQADEVVELLKKHYSKVEVVPVKKTSVQVKYLKESLEDKTADELAYERYKNGEYTYDEYVTVCKQEECEPLPELKEAWGDYKAYDKAEGWTDADIELHKNTDWKARNYEVLPTEDEYVGEVHLVGGDKNGTIKNVKFHKVIRSNPIFPPYYKPDEDYEGYLGPMFDGEKHNGIDIHNRYETQEVYDALSEAKEEKPEEEPSEKETDKWTKTFEEFLDLIEFELVKNEKKWALHDLQGANLGDIESETFGNATEILDRLDIYIGDYILDDLAEIIEDFDGTENLVSCEDYLNWYNTIGKEKYADELADSSWDFEVLDMIVNHGNDIDLEEVYHENDNDSEEVSHETAENLKEAYRGKDFDDYMRCLKILGYGSSDLERIKNENNFDEQELLNYLRKEAEEKGDK